MNKTIQDAMDALYQARRAHEEALLAFENAVAGTNGEVPAGTRRKRGRPLKAKRRAQKGIACDQCSFVAANGTGLAAHVRSKHPLI